MKKTISVSIALARRIITNPLFHFLTLGAAIFVLFEIAANEGTVYDSKIINVDRDALLTFVQYRTRAFEPAAAAARLAGMTEEELERLIDDYVREEALHREAKALGVDRNDYVIKRRMIQSIEFITDGFVAAAVEVTDEDIAAYYEKNREEYYRSPVVTFAHVFIDGTGRPRTDAYALASAKLEELNREQASFGDAPGHGDRFPLFVNYVDRDPQFIASHFGAAMARAVFELEPNDSAWHGPFESEFGLHLVMLSKKTEGTYPTLTEIANTVRDDAVRDKTAATKEQAIQAIVDTYDVRRTFGPPAVMQAKN